MLCAASPEPKLEPVAAQPAVPSPPPSPPAAGEARTRKDGQALVPGERVIWEDTEWPCWPLCCCLAPLCCSITHWTVTTARIDKKSGCCGTSEDTLDLRRITDMKYSASALCCCFRGTVTIFSGDTTDARIDINTWGTRKLYRDLKEAWSLAKTTMGTTIEGGDANV